MYLTLIYNALIVFFLCILYGRVSNLSGPVLVSAGNCCNSSSGSDSKNDPAYGSTGDTNKQSSKSESGFSLDLSSPKSDDSNYTYSKAHGAELHLFTIKSNCTEIKCDSKEVWKRSTSDKTNPSRVRYHKDNAEVTIYFGESKYKKFKKDGENWKEENQQTGTDQTGKTGTGGTGTQGGTTPDGTGGGGGTGGGRGTGGGGTTGTSGGGTGTKTGTGGGKQPTSGSGTTPGSPTSGGGSHGTSGGGTGNGGLSGGGTGTKGKTT